MCEFTPNCLSIQWSLGTVETKLVAGEEKCSFGIAVGAGEWKSCPGRHKKSPGRVSPGVLQRGVQSNASNLKKAVLPYFFISE